MKKLFNLIIIVPFLMSCAQNEVNDLVEANEENNYAKEWPNHYDVIINEILFTGAEELSNQIGFVCLGRDPHSWLDMTLSYGTNPHKSVFGVICPSKEWDKYRAFTFETGKYLVALYDSLGIQDRGYPHLYFAGLREGACIRADKTLFGIDKGKPLNDFFAVISETFYRATYPHYFIKESHLPSEMEFKYEFDDFFAKGDALTFCNSLVLERIPPEKYEEITFTIEIPIECEYMQQIVFGEDYPENYYRQGLVERNENRVLRGSVTVRFEE